MEISARFLDILRSIDYHVDHLPKDLFANEERLPGLLPVFTWFINNVSTKSNCVTPKELALYASISSKHDHFTSLETVSKAIEKFYDESTKDSIVCSSDLDCLEKKILKSQQELNNLKTYGVLYEKKLSSMDKDISLLKEKEKCINTHCYKAENNLRSVMKIFTEEIIAFGLNINKLHSHVTNSLTNKEICLTELASNNLVDLTESWRQQIYKIINMWFKKENISLIDNDKLSEINTLNLLFESVTAMKTAEINAKCDILKLNIALNNVYNIKNYCNEYKENLRPDVLDITNYLDNHVKHQQMSINSGQQLAFSEYDNLKSRIFDIVVTDGEKKIFELEMINDRITFVLESVEHYIMMCDILQCLMKVNCSMINLKCELVLNCINFLETLFDDIKCVQQWLANHVGVGDQLLHVDKIKNTTIHNEVVKFNGYKRYPDIYNSDEIKKLSKIMQQWKSKYHYTREECNKLAALQQELQVYSNTINGLVAKHSNTI